MSIPAACETARSDSADFDLASWLVILEGKAV
jgi:hypothetical protein